MLNYKKNASRTVNSRSAFTLIELSIVLIIIGLLVAGITGGAALINAAKLRSVMTDANANKIAANNFYSQYAALPGDFDKATGTGAAGDKDGLIDIGSATTLDEVHNAFNQLVDTGIISTDITLSGASATGHVALTPGTDIPQQKDYSGLGFIFVGENSENFVLGTGATTVAATTAIADAGGAIFKGEDALAIDAKMDDGTMTTGDVRGFNGVAKDATATTCSYSDSDIVCTVGWKLDIPTDI